MADASLDLDELVDLKMLPAWVSGPPPTERYAQHDGEDRQERRGRDRREGRGPQRKRPTPNFQRPTSKPEGPRRQFDRPGAKDRRPERPGQGDRRPQRRDDRRPGLRRGPHGKDRPHQHHRPAERPLPPIAVKFLPRAAAFQSVVDQIKSGTVAYSLFALARLFLEKAPRHDVKLTAPPNTPLFQLGENGAVSVNRDFLERNAFRFGQADFYKIEVTETEPIKGNFTNVARDRLSGTLLGPTNHHDYQRRLRNLYEQRFSRRMNFSDFQRQIQIVTDPAEIEKWKDEARKVTTYSTLREESAQTFSSVNEAERHFQKNYLPGIVKTVSEIVIDGPASRHLHDRVLNKVIENEWNRETRSPSPMMQELASGFREVGLHVFRHRKGMLFVSPVFPRPFRHDEEGVSSQVRTILEAIGAQPRIGRKELADKMIADPQKTVEASVPAAEETEKAKLALASDLLWLINTGYVIEFNDGSLDLPRVKTKAKDGSAVEAGAPPAKEGVAAAVLAAPKRSEGGPAAGDGSTESRPTEKEADAALAEEGVAAAVLGAPEQGKGGSVSSDGSTDYAPASSPEMNPDKGIAAERYGSRPTEEQPTEIGGS